MRIRSLFRFFIYYILCFMFVQHEHIYGSNQRQKRKICCCDDKVISQKSINRLVKQDRNQQDAAAALDKLKDFKNGLITAMENDGKVCQNLLTKLKNCQHVSFINVTRFTPNDKNDNKTETATQDTLNTVKEALEQYLELTKNTLTFVVFDEMFWSQVKPLNSPKRENGELFKEQIDTMIKELSKQYQNAFFVVNYLYESEIENGNVNTFKNYLNNNLNSISIDSFTTDIVKVFRNCDKIKVDQNSTRFNPLYIQSLFITNNGMMNNFLKSINDLIYLCVSEYLTEENIADKIQTLFNYKGNCVNDNIKQNSYDLIKNYIKSKIKTDFKKINHTPSKKLQNQTIIIHNSNELVKHSKHGYYNEDNDGILSRRSVYVPGDGYNHNGSDFNVEPKTAKYLYDNLGIEICLDLNLGKNKANEFKARQDRDNDIVQPEKLLLVQSNHIEIFDKDNIDNLPDDTIISHSDTKLLLSNYHKIGDYNDGYHQVQYSAGYNFLHFKKGLNLSKLLRTTIGDTYICKKDSDYVNITLEIVEL